MRVTAKVLVELQVKVDQHWPDDITVSQARSLAADMACSKIRRALGDERGITVGKTSVELVIVREELT